MVVGEEEISYTLPNSGKRQTNQRCSVGRFCLWILREKAIEITNIFEQGDEPEVLTE